MGAKNNALIVGGVALAVLAIAYYAKRQIAGVGESVGAAVSEAWDSAAEGAAYIANEVNPLNANNFVNRSNNSLYRSIDGAIYNLTGDALMGNQTAPINVPGLSGYDNTKPATNMGGYKMNLGDVAIASVANFKWFWEK